MGVNMSISVARSRMYSYSILLKDAAAATVAVFGHFTSAALTENSNK